MTMSPVTRVYSRTLPMGCLDIHQATTLDMGILLKGTPNKGIHHTLRKAILHKAIPHKVIPRKAIPHKATLRKVILRKAIPHMDTLHQGMVPLVLIMGMVAWGLC
ncbi:hypothetical protein QJS04_geneDACA010515 [Acorus gramineus]|uniref:Uncharacterized protein n=1 Tax=Acorus gramineus TaxID=55184 RepID=A0AAV9AK56_ACOGR|nr:hypothetical protein QJS04_geneDACA010515 [Acorus gramineus]